MTNTPSVDLTDPSRTDLLACARMLHDAERLSSVDELFDFLDKPWKWQCEIQLWTEAGRPQSDDEGWELFTRRLERSDEISSPSGSSR